MFRRKQSLLQALVVCAVAFGGKSEASVLRKVGIVIAGIPIIAGPVLIIKGILGIGVGCAVEESFCVTNQVGSVQCPKTAFVYSQRIPPCELPITGGSCAYTASPYCRLVGNKVIPATEQPSDCQGCVAAGAITTVLGVTSLWCMLTWRPNPRRSTDYVEGEYIPL